MFLSHFIFEYSLYMFTFLYSTSKENVFSQHNTSACVKRKMHLKRLYAFSTKPNKLLCLGYAAFTSTSELFWLLVSDLNTFCLYIYNIFYNLLQLFILSHCLYCCLLKVQTLFLIQNRRFRVTATWSIVCIKSCISVLDYTDRFPSSNTIGRF